MFKCPRYFFQLNLTVPPGILSSLQKKIESIKKIAKDCGIEVSPPKNMNLVKVNDTNEIDSKPISINNFTKLHRESSFSEGPSTSSIYKADEAMETTEKVNVSSEQVTDNIKDKLTKNTGMEQSSQKAGESRRDSLRGAGDYKYGYEDIITGTFEEKLEKCLSEGITISMENHLNDKLNDTLYEEYKTMIQSKGYKNMKSFREILPAYKKSKDILNAINKNQVIVISGETGCGKSTQVT